MTLVVLALAFWIAAYVVNNRLAKSRWQHKRWVRFFVPALFGVTVIAVWEGLGARIAYDAEHELARVEGFDGQPRPSSATTRTPATITSAMPTIGP